MEGRRGWAMARAAEALSATAMGLQVDAASLPYLVFRAYLALKSEQAKFDEEQRERSRRDAEMRAGR